MSKRCTCRVSEAITAEDCFEEAARELRAKNMPMSVYSGSGMSSHINVAHTAAAQAWVELANAILRAQGK